MHYVTCCHIDTPLPLGKIITRFFALSRKKTNVFSFFMSFIRVRNENTERLLSF